MSGFSSDRLTFAIIIASSVAAAGSLAYYFSNSSNLNSGTEVLGEPVAPEGDYANDPTLNQDAVLDAKEASSYAAVLADPRVSKYTSNAFNIDYNFLAKELSGSTVDEVNLRVVTTQTVTGDWHTSQERIYSGVHDIKIDLINGVVGDVVATPVPDKKESIVFTEQDKAIIAPVMEDSRVKQLIAGKDNVYVFSLYGGTYFNVPNSPCNPGSCWVVTLAEVNTKNTLHAWVNTETNQVVKMMTNGNW